MGSTGDGSCQPSRVSYGGVPGRALLPLMPAPIHPFPWAPCREQGHAGGSTAKPPISQGESSQGPAGSVSCQPEEFISQEISGCVLPLCCRENTETCFSWFSRLLVVTGTSPFIAGKGHRKTITSRVLEK